MNSQQKQKLINLLTICRKAGKLIMGFDTVKDMVKKSEASIAMAAEDISANTLKEMRFFCKNNGTDVVMLEISSDDMLYAVGKKTVAMAVCDPGFAAKILRLCDDDKTVPQKNKSSPDTDLNVSGNLHK